MEKEQTQEGAVEEPVKEETSKPASEAASTEEKATSEKKVDDEWKRTMQSRTDKAEYALKSTQEELQKLRKEREQERLEARSKEIAALADEPEEQAKLRRKHQLEDSLLRLEEQKTQQEGAVQRKYDQVVELASKHNLSLNDARELMNAESPKHMEEMARRIIAERKQIPATPPKEEPSDFTPDSGKSDAGGEDDETFMKQYSEGKSDDHKRARKILQKMK